tara:strand:+ start:4878 stop:5183 length:306 start_codon:yes stop_codon:yes gene_type:complete
MIVSHLTHVYFKIAAERVKAPAAFSRYISDKWNQIGFFISFAQSWILTLVGWDAYLKAVNKYPSINLELYVAIAVAFIGFGGSSLWTNIMSKIQARVDKVN